MRSAELRLAPPPGWWSVPLVERDIAVRALRTFLRESLGGDSFAQVRGRLLPRLAGAADAARAAGGRVILLSAARRERPDWPMSIVVYAVGEGLEPPPGARPELSREALRRVLSRSALDPVETLMTDAGVVVRTRRRRPADTVGHVPPSFAADYWMTGPGPNDLALASCSSPCLDAEADLIARWDAIVATAAWTSDDPSEE